MHVFSTPEQVAILKARFSEWEQEGFPGIDPGFETSLSLLNQFPGMAPVYSCTGHKLRNTETKRITRSDFYVILAATEEGFNTLRSIYQTLQDKLVTGYTARHVQYKALVSEHGKSDVVAKFMNEHPVALPNLLRLSHTVRVWPISTAGGIEELHDGDTDFYNVVLIAAATASAPSVIKSFLHDFTEAVTYTAALMNIDIPLDNPHT